jgi:hypothetical protein
MDNENKTLTRDDVEKAIKEGRSDFDLREEYCLEEREFYETINSLYGSRSRKKVKEGLRKNRKAEILLTPEEKYRSKRMQAARLEARIKDIRHERSELHKDMLADQQEARKKAAELRALSDVIKGKVEQDNQLCEEHNKLGQEHLELMREIEEIERSMRIEIVVSDKDFQPSEEVSVDGWEGVTSEVCVAFGKMDGDRIVLLSKLICIQKNTTEKEVKWVFNDEELEKAFAAFNATNQ